MTTERKQPPKPLDEDEILRAAGASIKQLITERQRIKERIKDARKEIEDGARPKRGRFRL